MDLSFGKAQKSRGLRIRAFASTLASAGSLSTRTDMICSSMCPTINCGLRYSDTPVAPRVIALGSLHQFKFYNPTLAKSIVYTQ